MGTGEVEGTGALRGNMGPVKQHSGSAKIVIRWRLYSHWSVC